MKNAAGEIVAGLIADVVTLHHQHEATRGLCLALARAAARNGSISPSEMIDAIHEASAYLTATGRSEAARLMVSMSDDLHAFAFGGDRHIISAAEPAEAPHWRERGPHPRKTRPTTSDGPVSAG